MGRPASQALKGNACALVALPGGDLVWCGDSRSRLSRHDWKAKKTVELVTASPPRHLALAGPGRILGAAFDFDKQEDYAAIYDATTGATIHELRFPKPRESVRAVAATADGARLAVATGHINAPSSSIEIFSSEGKHEETLELGRDGVTNTAEALIFTTDGAALRYVVRGELVTHTLGTKKSTKVACKIPDVGNPNPRTTRQDKLLLVQFHAPGHTNEAFVIDEETGRVKTKIPDCELVSFGTDGLLVWQLEDTVKVLDTSGKTKASFKRRKRTRLEAAATNEHGYWCAGGPGGIELYDLARLAELGSAS
jgi:hypothetical protein